MGRKGAGHPVSGAVAQNAVAQNAVAQNCTSNKVLLDACFKFEMQMNFCLL